MYHVYIWGSYILVHKAKVLLLLSVVAVAVCVCAVKCVCVVFLLGFKNLA